MGSALDARLFDSVAPLVQTISRGSAPISSATWTRAFSTLLRLPSPGMAAGCGIAKVLAQPGNHGVHNARVHRRGGTVVKVNRKVGSHVHGWLGQIFGLAIAMQRLVACRKQALRADWHAATRFQSGSSGFSEHVAQGKHRIGRVHADRLDHRGGGDGTARCRLVFDRQALGKPARPPVSAA